MSADVTATPTPGNQQNNTNASASNLSNYRRVPKTREQTPDDEIRVTALGHVAKYVTYAARLFTEQNKQSLTIRATGQAVSIAVGVCEVVKRRFKGLHQVTQVGSTEIVDHYEGITDDIAPLTETRNVASISIFLTKDESLVDKTAVGYQMPLDESLVVELDPESVMSTSRGRGGRRRGRGRRAGYNGRNQPKESGGGGGGTHQINEEVGHVNGEGGMRGGGGRGRGGGRGGVGVNHHHQQQQHNIDGDDGGEETRGGRRGGRGRRGRGRGARRSNRTLVEVDGHHNGSQQQQQVGGAGAGRTD